MTKRTGDDEWLLHMSELEEQAGGASFNPVPVPPFEILREYMEHIGISEDELATRLRLSIPETECLLDGRLSITDEIADRLEIVFSRPAQFWINLRNLGESR